MSANLPAALNLATHGYRILPVDPLTGRSLLSDPEAQASASPKQITEWFTRWPDAAIGLLLGKRTGLACIETSDSRAETVVEWFLRDATSEPPTFRQGRTVGRLVEFIPEATGNALHATRGLRVRSEGFVIVPPSPAPGHVFCEWLTHPSETSVPDCGFQPTGLDDGGIQVLSNMILERRERDPAF